MLIKESYAEMERHRIELEKDRSELTSRVNLLAQEVSDFFSLKSKVFILTEVILSLAIIGKKNRSSSTHRFISTICLCRIDSRFNRHSSESRSKIGF